MISYKHRFHGRNSIKTVYSNGKSARTGSLGLRYSYNPKRKDYRVAVVVSKKIHKSAVKRNRIRRRVYELVRLHQSDLQGSDKVGVYDLVFSAYSDALSDMPAKELEAQVVRLLSQAK